MDQPSPVTEFSAGNSRALRAAGLTGRHVWGRLHEGSLELRGEAGGVLRIAPGDVSRLRVGYTEGARRIYQLRVWRDGSAPLTIAPYPATWKAYRRIVEDFVELMITGQGRERVEGGSTHLDAILGPALMGLVALGAVAVAIFALGDEPWWGRLLLPALPVGLALLLIWLGVTRHWPRPVRALPELGRQLPPHGARR